MSKVAAKLTPNMSSAEYQTTMYEVAYDAEKLAFTKRVIKQSFEVTGTYPF